MTDAPAEWLPDPTGRHDHRYWDGTRWTEHVADAGVAAIEPYEAPTAPIEAAAPVAPVEPVVDQPAQGEATAPWTASPWSTPEPTAVAEQTTAVAEQPTAVAEQPTAVAEPTAVEQPTAVVEQPTTVEPTGRGGSRRLIVLLALAAVVAIVVVLVLLATGTGDSSSNGSGGALSTQLASRLRSANGYDKKDAGCVADYMVSRIGTNRLKGVDLTGEQVPADLQSDFAKALGDGISHCKVNPPTTGTLSTVVGAPTTLPSNPQSVAQTKQFFVQYYEQNLGLTDKQAQCLADTLIDAVASGKAKVGTASSAFPDALKSCNIPADALKNLGSG